MLVPAPGHRSSPSIERQKGGRIPHMGCLGRRVRVRSDATSKETRPHRARYGQIRSYKTDAKVDRYYLGVQLDGGTEIKVWPNEVDIVR